MAKTIVISGGPGSGKTTIINQLSQRGYACYDEISRDIIQEGQEAGVDQLFLTHPELFSKKLLKGRIQQYIDAKLVTDSIVFLDRGIPDIVAYMDFKKEASPKSFTEACEKCVYDFVFLLPPWENIYKQDNERYETFEESKAIYENLKNAYINYGYEIVEVPFGNLIDRVNYILNVVEYS